MKKRALILSALLMCALLYGCGREIEVKGTIQPTEPENTLIEVQNAAEEYVGRNYQVVVNELESEGFTNITTSELEDIDSESLFYEGDVETVSINGNTQFNEKTVFEKDASVVVTYHTTRKIVAPLSSEDIQDSSYTEIEQKFVEAGFSNVKTEEIYDLDPDTMEAAYKNEVTIDGWSTFQEGDKFPFDAQAVITCHYPYEKRTVKMHINFTENLIFSRYNVSFYINGELQDTLPHGQDKDYELRLKEGEYKLRFESTDNSSLKSEVELDVTGDIQASYKVSCYNDRVEVKTIFVENRSAVGENECMMPMSASDYMGKNYKEIVKSLEQAGFTNISTEVLYDIVWGWTEEESSDEISVGGRTDFRRGDIFTKDVSIIVTYHLKEEDDPVKKAEAEEEARRKEEEERKVSYSTNDKSTVKNGNAGVYSYQNLGGSYSIYYIIDFDEGYVYYFCHGNEDETCDRVKIVSGDLNDVLIITYHVGEDEWSYGLHFKWKNQPDHLIVQDEDGFEWDYYTTDLEDALDLRDSKKIKDY